TTGRSVPNEAGPRTVKEVGTETLVGELLRGLKHYFDVARSPKQPPPEPQRPWLRRWRLPRRWAIAAAALLLLGIIIHVATDIAGRGVPKDDAQAVAWARKAADQGHAKAQNNLGIMYLYGHWNSIVVPVDYAQAIAWFRKAADQGHADAQNNLGVMLVKGRGVPKDDDQARAWFRKAADQGNSFGQFCFGVTYENGIGVPKDNAQAVAWYRKAAAQQQPQAINALRRLAPPPF